MPRSVSYNGVTHNFPDGTSDDEIRSVLNGYDLKGGFGPSKDITPPASTLDYKNAPDRSTEYNRQADSFKKNLPVGLADSLPALGAAFTGPESGFLASGLGAAGGSLIKQGLKKSFPSTFGEGPSDVGDSALETGKDTLLSGIIPTAVGKAIGGIPTIANKIVSSKNPAIKDWIKSKLDKYITSDADTVAQAADNARSNIPPNRTVPENIDNLMGVPGKPTTRSAYFDNENIGPIANKALSDITQVRSFKAATGEPYTIDTLASNKIINKGYTGDGIINPNAILSELKGVGNTTKADAYREALQPETYKNIEDMMNKIKEIQPDQGRSNIDKVLQWTGRRILFTVPAAIGGSLLGGLGGAGTSIALSESAVALLARNPVIGRLAIKALETPAGSVEAPFIQKALVQGLRGASVLVPNKDEGMEKAVIGQDGRVTYPASPGR